MNPQDHRPVFYRLHPAIQGAEWGNHSEDGLIRRLLEKQGRPTESRPYAELWKGSHPSAPSRVRGHHFSLKEGQLYSEEMALNEAIHRDPDHFLGASLHAKGHTSLPFLFKVLDAARPLSIQAHPDRALAAELHKNDSRNYPDSNHKPELAISLGHFEALVGFRPIDEFMHQLDHIPSLAGLCGNEPENIAGRRMEPAKVYSDAMSRIMRADPESLKVAAADVLHRLNQVRANPRDAWFVHLAEHYGHEDPGIFVVFLLNYLQLSEGEGIFLAPNEPHAYLKGEILECMASSDNVVRAGLTTKNKDVNTLLRMLTYRSGRPPILLPVPEGAGPYPATYPVPVDDFSVSLLHRPEHPVAFVPLRPLSILLQLEGTATLRAVHGDRERTADVSEGEALFLPGDLNERGLRLFIEPSADSLIYEASTGL